MSDAEPIYAAIEAGGTKIVCGLGSAVGSIETVRIETRAADATLAEVAAYFAAARARHGPFAGVGIASFGPLELDPGSPRYGFITSTPKPGWRDIDLLGAIRSALGVPTAIDTDVNAAALAEAQVWAGEKPSTTAYATIGTGIGVGIAIDGAVRHIGGHAEAGHLSLRRHPAHGDFPGTCPFHGDCLEGLAAGPAVIAAWGGSLDTLPADHPAWTAEADYLGQLCAALVMMLMPDRIVLGGGIMAQERLFADVRRRTGHWLGGYIERFQTPAALDALIVPPVCTEPSGLVGAYLLAANAVARDGSH